MTIYCPFCGTKCNKSNWGRYHCPNCGCIAEDPDAIKPKSENEGTPSYVG